MTAAGVRPGRSPLAVVAGVLCLDLIPNPGARGRQPTGRPDPGALEVIGPMTLAIGGCVGNTGVALHRLGLRTTLVARVGDDPFGRILTGLVRGAVTGPGVRLIATPGGATSYSLIESRPDADRAIRHFPGVNDAFVAADVPSAVLQGARLLHVGYPPLMAALSANDGKELEGLLAAGRSAGAITSLDMAAVAGEPTADRARWLPLLRRVLPAVDVFLPSLDEAGHILGHTVRRDERGDPVMEDLAAMTLAFIDMGVAIAGLKLGRHGLYVRTASGARTAAVPGRLSPAWAERELYSSVFQSLVVGTTGAGDATIAGFLHGVAFGDGPEACVTAACAVGGTSAEAVDGTSGIPAWPVIAERLAGGWPRRHRNPGRGWRPSGERGLWVGPLDAGAPAG